MRIYDILCFTVGYVSGCLVTSLYDCYIRSLTADKKAFDEARYQAWKAQVGLAERGDVDEQTIRNIWAAIDDEDK